MKSWVVGLATIIAVGGMQLNTNFVLADTKNSTEAVESTEEDCGWLGWRCWFDSEDPEDEAIETAIQPSEDPTQPAFTTPPPYRENIDNQGLHPLLTPLPDYDLLSETLEDLALPDSSDEVEDFWAPDNQTPSIFNSPAIQSELVEEPGPEYLQGMLGFGSMRVPPRASPKHLACTTSKIDRKKCARAKNNFASYSIADPFREKSYLSLAPEVKVIGPDKKKDGDTDRLEYFPTVFRYILQAADQALRDYNEGDNSYVPTDPNRNYTYYTWLITALTVTHHESQLTHFIKGSGEICNERLNGVKVYKPGSSYERYMMTAYRDPYNVLAPDCEYLRDEPVLNKILVSDDYSDFGFMQLNIHYQRQFINPEYAFDLRRTIDAGLRYLWDQNGTGGFAEVRGRYKKGSDLAKIDCSHLDTGFSFKVNPFYEDVYNDSTMAWERKYKPGTQAANYFNLAHAAWIGYNTGKVYNRSICRIAGKWAYKDIEEDGEIKTVRSHIEYDSRDPGFLRSLNAIVKYNTSIWHKGLHPDTDEYKAFLEIVHNYRRIFMRSKPPEKDFYIKKILREENERYDPYVKPVTHLGFRANYLVTVDKTPLFGAPTSMVNFESTVCGYLERPKKLSPVQVNVTRLSMDEITGDEYAEIELPKYDLLSNLHQLVVLKDSLKIENVRSSPKAVGKNCSPDDILNTPNYKHNCIGQWHHQEPDLILPVESDYQLGQKPMVQFVGSYPIVEYSANKKWVKFRYQKSGDESEDYAWIYRPSVHETMDDTHARMNPLCNKNRFFIEASNIVEMDDEPKVATLKSKVMRATAYLTQKGKKRQFFMYSTSKPWRKFHETHVLVLTKLQDNDGKWWAKVKNLHHDIGYIDIRDLEMTGVIIQNESFNMENVEYVRDALYGDNFEE